MKTILTCLLIGILFHITSTIIIDGPNYLEKKIKNYFKKIKK